MGKTACFNPRPIQLKEIIVNDDGSYLSRINVPCGKCENCIRRKRMEWCFRMEEELKISKNALFVTLTYDDEHLPIDKYKNVTLKQEHLVNFFKRLRINTERNNIITPEIWLHGITKKDKIKYYACGEYGEQYGRPHYHAIIFNASTRLIKDSWGMGLIDSKPATRQSIAYVTKYMDKWRNKKQDWKKAKEFNIQSKGLGKEFIKRMKTFYKNNLDINYMVNSRGIKIPLSRYYNLKILNEDSQKKKTSIIHNALENERAEKVKKLGLAEFNKREKSKQNFIKKVFESRTKKRSM